MSPTTETRQTLNIRQAPETKRKPVQTLEAKQAQEIKPIEAKPIEVKSEPIIKKEQIKKSEKCCPNCKKTTPVAIDFTSSYKSASSISLDSTDGASIKHTLSKPEVSNKRDKSPGMSIGGLLNDR